MKTPISPKVVAAGFASFIVPALLLGLLFLQTPEGQEYFGGLPKIVVVILGGLITSAITALSAYQKRDPLRDLGAEAAVTGEQPNPDPDEAYEPEIERGYQPDGTYGVRDANGDGHDDTTGHFLPRE